MAMAAYPPDPTHSFTLPPSPFPAPIRKRRAGSPPTPTAPTPTSPPSKRRRPNLANGFQSLSISHDLLPTTAQNINDQSDDEGIGLRPADFNDVQVEILPDAQGSVHPHPHSHAPVPPRKRPHWSIPNHAGPSSPSSSSSSDENYDSDATYTRSYSYTGPGQPPDEIVQPSGPLPFDTDLTVEDVTSPLRTRRRPDEYAPMPESKRPRRETSMEIDGDPELLDRRRKRKTIWHEPEKDRIVITALSDASSASSRSPSPDLDERNLTQPGSQGFTISPSLLTHLLKSQRNQFNPAPKNHQSLVLYRPLGIPPGNVNEDYVDTGRFEVLEDDDEPDAPMDVDGDVAMG